MAGRGPLSDLQTMVETNRHQIETADLAIEKVKATRHEGKEVAVTATSTPS